MHVFNKIWIKMFYTCVYVCICVSVSCLGYSPYSTVFLKKSISFTTVQELNLVLVCTQKHLLNE